ncbi:MAG: hypothetical protein KKA73_00390 [Chloroflexi bacterium]|nr:hypothetical protein [Chloroflexota bacterium]MBU1746120.1 hypothetical protein [Chloroflexota bacterium]
MHLLHDYDLPLPERTPQGFAASSGPPLRVDRIDIHVDVPRVDYDKLADDRRGEPSARTQSGERVEHARAVQRERFENTTLATNADTPARAP